MKKRLLALTLAVAMVMTAFVGCGSKELDESAAVATVGGEEIKAGVANFYARYQQSQYETYYAAYLGDDMWNTQVEAGVTYEDSVKDSIMEALQIMYVIRQHAEEYGITLTDADKEAIAKAAAAFVEGNGSDEIATVSGSQENVEELLSLMTIQSRMYKEMIKDVDKAISDEEAAQKSMDYVYFSFSTANEEGVSEKLSEEDKKELKAEAEALAAATDFAAFAKEKGYEATTLTFDAETTSISADVIAAADKLAVGENTGVIETEYGYYVAVVTSLLDREATDAEKETILYEREQNLYAERYTEWLEAAEVSVNESVWKSLDFEKVGVTIKGTETEETIEE